MLEEYKLNSIVHFDIETASGEESYEQLSSPMKLAWNHKHKVIKCEDMTPAESYEMKAALYPEFGRVVCISYGVVLRREDGSRYIYVDSFYGKDEKAILNGFSEMLKAVWGKNRGSYLCGHNIKKFDIPFLAKRIIINRLRLPKQLNMVNKKPWEVNWCIDTMDIWRMGNFQGNESIKVLTAVFGVPTPKDDIDGSMVSGVFWSEEGGLFKN